MFKCTSCKTVDSFELMFAPDYNGSKTFQISHNAKGEVEITVDGYKFIPDLEFMNSFAVCKYCGSIYHWDYDVR